MLILDRDDLGCRQRWVGEPLIDLFESLLPCLGLFLLAPNRSGEHHRVAGALGNALPEHTVQAGRPFLELVFDNSEGKRHECLRRDGTVVGKVKELLKGGGRSILEDCMAQGLFCIEVRQVDKVTNVATLVQNLLLLRKNFTPAIPNIGGDLRSLVTELPCAHELREEEVDVCPTRLRAADHGWDLEVTQPPVNGS